MNYLRYTWNNYGWALVFIIVIATIAGVKLDWFQFQLWLYLSLIISGVILVGSYLGWKKL
jgi:hypothetical protein